jgi:hypothetical protein
MALYRWPTDPPGKPAAHTIPYQTHIDNLAAAPGSKVAPYSQISVSLGGGQSAPISQYGTGPGKIAPYSQIPVSIGGGKTIPADQYQAWLAKQGGAAGAPGGGGGGGAAASPYSASNLPPDPQYDAQVLAAQKRRDFGLTGLTGERTRELSDYGFTEGPGGPVFDPNNPFSKAAVLKYNYDKARRASAQSMGSTGGLYSGAFQSTQDYVNRGQLGAEDALTKGLQAFLAANTRSAEQVGGLDYTDALNAAAEGRIGRFQTNPLYNPPPAPQADTTDGKPPVPDYATPGPAAPAAKAYKTRRGKNSLGHMGTWHDYPDGHSVFIKD